ncbi:ABC transporter permease [Homoserinimonas sp. A447]
MSILRSKDSLVQARPASPFLKAVSRPVFAIRGVLLLIIPVVLWQVLGSPNPFSFPVPDTWFPAIYDLHQAGLLMPAVERTLTTFVLSLIIATIIGVAMGILIGLIPLLDRALTPFMDFFRAVPPPAIVPALGLLLGPDLPSSVTIVVLAIIWPILLNTVTGIRSIPPVRLDMARSLGLSRAEQLFKVVVPSLGPSVMVGLRISVSMSLIVTLVTDIIGTGQGLGRLLIDQQQFFESSAVWGLLVMIGLFGYLINVLFGLAQRIIFSRWPEGSRPVG